MKKAEGAVAATPLSPGQVFANTSYFRPGTKARIRHCNYLITQGGMGDYICYLSALRFLASEHPQIYGTVYVTEFMVEIYQNVLAPWFPRWKVVSREKADEKEFTKNPTFSPQLRPLNATGAHPIDLGFAYFAGLSQPPEGWNEYPPLSVPTVKKFKVEGKYAVMCPGSTTPNRTMKAETFNGIKDGLIARGIIPVFLGKKQMTDIREIKYCEEYNYEGGIDLRDQTSLMMAAGIMSKAELVVGLDTGLLHLAACTKVPILFGYNIASPEHRRPRRPSGNIWEIYPDVKTLPCTFCQSRMRFMFDHDFAVCLYKDNACLDALGKPEDWLRIVDKCLAAKK